MENDPTVPITWLTSLSKIDSNLSSWVYINHFKNVLESQGALTNEVLTPFAIIWQQAYNAINQQQDPVIKQELYKNIITATNNYVDNVSQMNISDWKKSLAKMTMAYWLQPRLDELKQMAPKELNKLVKKLWPDLWRTLDSLTSSSWTDLINAFGLATWINTGSSNKSWVLMSEKKWTEEWILNIPKVTAAYNTAKQLSEQMKPTWSSNAWWSYMNLTKSPVLSANTQVINVNDPKFKSIIDLWEVKEFTKHKIGDIAEPRVLAVSKWKVIWSTYRPRAIMNAKVYKRSSKR